MKISFVDHHLNNYHANMFLKLLRGSGHEIVSAWESDAVGDDWCAANRVPRAASIDEAVSAGDVVLLLAPDNVEDHLKLCSQVLPAGKRTFIDKFLAPNLADAREIASLAQKTGAAIFSSSSLYFNAELEAAAPSLRQPVVEAYGRGVGKWSGYGIHSIGMVQRIMGRGVMRVADTGIDGQRLVALDYGNGRRALVEVRESGSLESFTWQFGGRSGDALVTGVVKEYGQFYANLMINAVRFFETGAAPFGIEIALEAVAILEAADGSLAKDGAWVTL